jgi:hypothetical protein
MQVIKFLIKLSFLYSNFISLFILSVFDCVCVFIAARLCVDVAVCSHFVYANVTESDSELTGIKYSAPYNLYAS